MRYNSRGTGIPKNRIIIITCVLVLVLAVLLVVAFLSAGNKNEGTGTQSSEPMEKMVLHTVEERGDAVYVTTSYGGFSYPYAYSDLMVMEPVNKTSYVGVAFFASIDGKNEPVYTLWINGRQGIPAGKLHVGDKTYSVTVEMNDARKDLAEKYRSTFYAAQETLNDVLLSMEAGGYFEYSMGGA